MLLLLLLLLLLPHLHLLLASLLWEVDEVICQATSQHPRRQVLRASHSKALCKEAPDSSANAVCV
jgi:hypothetical protein